MNIQPLNIQMLLLNLQHMSRDENHRHRFEELRLSRQLQRQSQSSSASDSRINAASPGQEDHDNTEGHAAVDAVNLSFSNSSKMHDNHYRRFLDPLVGHVINIRR